MDRPEPGHVIGRALDNVVIAITNHILGKIFIFAILATLMFSTVNGCLYTVIVGDTYTIEELNPNLWREPLAAQPFLRPTRTYDLHEYARLGSWRQCENWLLERGYKCRTIYCNSTDGKADSFVTTAVKGEPGSPNESIISINRQRAYPDFYGNRTFEVVPFHYNEGKSPIAWERFERIPVWHNDGLLSYDRGARTEFPIYRMNSSTRKPNLWASYIFNEGMAVYSIDKAAEERWLDTVRRYRANDGFPEYDMNASDLKRLYVRR